MLYLRMKKVFEYIQSDYYRYTGKKASFFLMFLTLIMLQACYGIHLLYWNFLFLHY